MAASEIQGIAVYQVEIFSLHILPEGFRKIRHFGILLARNKPQLKVVQKEMDISETQLSERLMKKAKPDVEAPVQSWLNPSCTYYPVSICFSAFQFFLSSVLGTTDFLRIKGAYL